MKKLFLFLGFLFMLMAFISPPAEPTDNDVGLFFVQPVVEQVPAIASEYVLSVLLLDYGDISLELAAQCLELREKSPVVFTTLPTGDIYYTYSEEIQNQQSLTYNKCMRDIVAETIFSTSNGGGGY